MRSSFIAIASLLFAVTSFSSTTEIPFTAQMNEHVKELKSSGNGYFDISNIEVTEVETPEDIKNRVEFESYYGPETFDLGSIIMNIDKLLALGKKVWGIIDAGKPTITTNFAPAISVLPKTSAGPTVAFYDMSGWQAPKVKSYKVAYKNGFKKSVIEFVYTVVFQYKGQLNGKGAYLTGLDVMASRIKVSWGFNFDANSALVNISNVGSSSNPEASAVLRVGYKVSNWMSTIMATETFYVTGTGLVQKL